MDSIDRQHHRILLKDGSKTVLFLIQDFRLTERWSCLRHPCPHEHFGEVKSQPNTGSKQGFGLEDQAKP